MTTSKKLDPSLRAMVELAGDAAAEGDKPVQVIIGLSAPASAAQIDGLKQKGLRVRSVIGDVLTGTAPLTKIEAIAEDKLVAKIEASGPLYKE